jgi:hypothetical protein
VPAHPRQARFVLVVAAALVLLSARASLARDWYVKGETGSDARAGTSWQDARQTFPTTLADGDVVHYDEVCRSRLYASGVSNLTVVGSPNAWVSGDTPTPAGPWVASGSAWSKTLPTGLAINAVVYGWDTSEDADGMRRAHLIREASATSVSGATGPKGRWHYDPATGRLTVYAAGENPNLSGKPVWYVDAANVENLSALTFRLCPHLRLVNCRVRLFVTNILGYGVFLDGASDADIQCTARDMGAHAVGAIGNAGPVTSARFSYVDSRGLSAAGTHTVHYAFSPMGPITGGRTGHGAPGEGGTIVLCRYLGLDGEELSGPAVPTFYNSGLQIGCYAHSDGSQASVQDVLYEGLVLHEVYPEGGEDGVKYRAFDAGDTPAPGNAWDWSTFAARADRCRIENSTVYRPFGNIAVRRTIFSMSRAGPSGLCGMGSPGCIGGSAETGSTMLYDSCAFLIDGSNSISSTAMFAVCRPGQDLRILNCSVLDTSTQDDGTGHIAFSWLFGSDRWIRARGTVVAFRTPGPHALCYNDAGVDPAHHDVLDCAYFNVGGLWSQNQPFSTQAGWLGSVDTAGVALGAPPFPDQPYVLDLSPVSPLWTLRRSVPRPAPVLGINDFYGGFFGAYQYPCYANCDGSAAAPLLNFADFSCFLQRFAAGDPYANCDGSTAPPTLNFADFSCFLQRFAAGCP